MFDHDPPYIRLDVIERIVPVAQRRGVSPVALSDRGFLVAYRVASGLHTMLGKDPHSGRPWSEIRREVINRHIALIQRMKKDWWLPSGQPSRAHLMLLMWAYTPTPERTAAWLTTL